MTWAGGGILLGLLGAWSISQAISSLLFDVSAKDPFTFVLTTCALTIVRGHDGLCRAGHPATSGGAPGAEAAFGEAAERYGVEEVNFTFDGHRMTAPAACACSTTRSCRPETSASSTSRG